MTRPKIEIPQQQIATPAAAIIFARCRLWLGAARRFRAGSDTDVLVSFAPDARRSR
jgi:hypothetical protein